jgi:hypothetical protein
VLAVLIVAATLGAATPPPDPPGAWMSPPARCEASAEKLRVEPALRPIVADMCRRSPTFRRQVIRLARQADLEVRLQPGRFSTFGRVRAQSALTRVDGHLRTAVVEVPAGNSVLLAELVAHEFEHILEQLDGVNLAEWAGRSGVYKVGADDREGPFETERARQIGRVVAGEFAAATGEITALRVR